MPLSAKLRLALRLASVLATLAFAAEAGHGQAIPTAIQQASLLAGAEVSNYSPSFAPNRMTGFGGHVDVDWRRGLGGEFEARLLELNSFHGEKQSTYLVGPRIFLPNRRWRPYGKLLAGRGDTTYPFKIGQGSYLALVAGAGCDYILNHQWRVRADYEFQHWRNSPGIPGEPDANILMPNGISVGMEYRIR